MTPEPDESLQREAYEESNSLGNCQKCGARLQEHSYIGTFCPVCTYHSIEKSFEISNPQFIEKELQLERTRIVELRVQNTGLL